MTVASRLGAVLTGLVLASMPVWRYAAPGFAVESHADHAPRYGGQLAMAGEHHVELVRRGAVIEVHVSDARRRPVRPAVAYTVVDGAVRVPLRWQAYRFVGRWDGTAHEIEAVAMRRGEYRIAVVFDVSVDRASPAA